MLEAINYLHAKFQINILKNKKKKRKRKANTRVFYNTKRNRKETR